MHGSNDYLYSRSSRGHRTSSAFSPNARPNEDWTKIPDRAERRRIQNRIAQRNRRMKRRLEDLENRAASTSEAPERSSEKPEPTVKSNVNSRATHSRASKSTSDAHRPASTDRLPYDRYSTQEDRGSMFSYQSKRQLFAPPSPIPSCPSYSALDGYGKSLCTHPPQYYSFSDAYNDLSYHGESFMAPLLPVSMHGAGPAMKKYSYGDEEIISPFNMSYALMAGNDLSPPQHHSSESSKIPVQLPSERLASSSIARAYMPALSHGYSDDLFV